MTTDVCIVQSELIHGSDKLPAAKDVIARHGLSLIEKLMRVNNFPQLKYGLALAT